MKPPRWLRKAPERNKNLSHQIPKAARLLGFLLPPKKRIASCLRKLRDALPSRPPMKIRRAKMTDAAVIADFNRRMAWETEKRRLKTETVRAGVRNLLKAPSKGRYFVAEIEQNGKRSVVGQLLITYEWSD